MVTKEKVGICPSIPLGRDVVFIVVVKTITVRLFWVFLVMRRSSNIVRFQLWQSTVGEIKVYHDIAVDLKIRVISIHPVQNEDRGWYFGNINSPRQPCQTMIQA